MDLPLRHLLSARFRASTRYGWTPYAELGDAERALLTGLHEGTGLAGLLTPAATGLSINGLDAESARLRAALAEPALLVDSRLESLEELVPVARLLLDGVLEVEHEGRFVSGADAFPLVFANRELPESPGALARLSLDALDYGASLRLDDPIALSWRLYRYNTLPDSPEWRRRLPDRQAVAAYLGLDRFDARAGLLQSSAGDHRLSTHKGWLSWYLRRNATARKGGTLWKLYVSPRVEALPDALQAIAALVPELPGAVSLKVGATLPGLLRPDKCVLYFRTRDQLDIAAERLAAELHGLPAHGVPFTAEASGTLLSWGLDPPEDRPILHWLGVESWRLWITNQLASALLVARTAELQTVTPARFALGRLSLEGVDPVTWAPHHDVWPAEQIPAGH
jgi:hypothetical protein